MKETQQHNLRAAQIMAGTAKAFSRQALALAAGALLFIVSCGQDNRTESVRFPSGDVLQNRTYFEPGFGGGRHNKLFLKGAKGGSEPLGDIQYEGNRSLLTQFPNPQELIDGDKKVVLIGPYLCQRWSRKFASSKAPWRHPENFDAPRSEALLYLDSFFKTNELELADQTHYLCQHLDLTNNVLTLKQTPSDGLPQLPEFLVYSAPGYDFPLRFDWMRTKARNGPRWTRPMPFHMTLDFSVITFLTPDRTYPPQENRQSALARTGAREVFATTLPLSDEQIRSAQCDYVLPSGARIQEQLEAMYAFACRQPKRHCIVWQPRDPAAWSDSTALTLDEWKQVGASGFEGNLWREEFIRLRQVGP